jgi:hypothetical protein
MSRWWKFQGGGKKERSLLTHRIRLWRAERLMRLWSFDPIPLFRGLQPSTHDALWGLLLLLVCVPCAAQIFFHFHCWFSRIFAVRNSKFLSDNMFMTEIRKFIPRQIAFLDDITISNGTGFLAFFSKMTLPPSPCEKIEVPVLFQHNLN